QGHSLAVCAELSKWFSGDPERSIEFVQVPSKIGWHIHLAAHNYVRDTPAVLGRHLETSLDSVHQAVAKSCVDSWISKFQHTSYWGKHFLQMRDMRCHDASLGMLCWANTTPGSIWMEKSSAALRSTAKPILPDAWENSWTFFRRIPEHLPLKPLPRVLDDFVGGPELGDRVEWGGSMLQCCSLPARRPDGGARTSGRLQTKGIGAGVWTPCAAPLAPVGLPTIDNTSATPIGVQLSEPLSRGRLVYQKGGGDPSYSNPNV
ncbi:hypothetical protein FA15DRAFT_662198, partial [Coprinopsis marcescibilis]